MLKEKIYQALNKVPKGYVTTYKYLANAVNSKAYRSVGSLMKNNKHPDKIPCYKVVKSDGSVGNYSGSGGIKRKMELLRKGDIEVKNGKVVDFKKRLWKFKS